ncbi:MAG: hypothetical protein EBZ49_09800 [Proteobacteria bacterium]|nr:hypothetical protein [Pseudomonadota bacterium]
MSSLTVTAPSLSVGGASQAQVIANFSNGETQDITGLVSYHSTNANLPVSSSGVINAPSTTGTTTLTASFGNVSSTLSVSAVVNITSKLFAFYFTPSPAIVTGSDSSTLSSVPAISDTAWGEGAYIGFYSE